jgi:cell division protein FtsB
VFDAGQPDYDKYTQTIAQGVPVETIKGHWEQTWIVLDLNDEQLADAQIQKIEDEKAKIKAEIAKLEDSVTPRRQREAILAIDTTWLADVELQIGQLRQQLMDL